MEKDKYKWKNEYDSVKVHIDKHIINNEVERNKWCIKYFKKEELDEFIIEYNKLDYEEKEKSKLLDKYYNISIEAFEKELHNLIYYLYRDYSIKDKEFYNINVYNKTTNLLVGGDIENKRVLISTCFIKDKDPIGCESCIAVLIDGVSESIFKDIIEFPGISTNDSIINEVVNSLDISESKSKFVKNMLKNFVKFICDKMHDESFSHFKHYNIFTNSNFENVDNLYNNNNIKMNLQTFDNNSRSKYKNPEELLMFDAILVMLGYKSKEEFNEIHKKNGNHYYTNYMEFSENIMDRIDAGIDCILSLNENN